MVASYISVTNGYPGADVWVTIYQSVTGIPLIERSDRRIQASGSLASGQSQTFQWDGVGDQCYVRCETSATIEGKVYNFSDTTVQGTISTSPTIPVYLSEWTLLPADEPRGTYLAESKQPMGTINLNLTTATEATQYLIQSDISHGDQYPSPTGYLSIDTSKANPCVIRDYPSSGWPPPGDMVWIKQDCQYGCLLTNMATNKLLYVDDGNGANPQLLPSTPLTQRLSLWTIGGQFNFWKPGDLGVTSRVALRPYVDDSQNLNVFGNGPYPPGNAVGTWRWGGGAPNEVWWFINNL